MSQTSRKTTRPAKPAAKPRASARRAAEEREIQEWMTRIDRKLDELHAQADETMRRLGIARGA